jgi:hypothetical protein
MNLKEKEQDDLIWKLASIEPLNLPTAASQVSLYLPPCPPPSSFFLSFSLSLSLSFFSFYLSLSLSLARARALSLMKRDRARERAHLSEPHLHVNYTRYH